MQKTWCISLFLFLQCCVKSWCSSSVLFVLQFGRLKLAQGAIYLYWISVVGTCFNPVLFISGIECVRLRDLSIPSFRFRESGATLGCNFDLEGERLYSVKWYKDGHEFYRFDIIIIPLRAKPVGR